MASLFSSLSDARRIARLSLLALLACLSLGMASKPLITVRFYAEAKRQDTDRFARPITFKNPPREGYIESVPSIHERHIKALFPFPAADGSMGCSFLLDNSGRLNLEVVSTERRGTSLVAFVGTKNGVHQVLELLIDKPILDGIITIPRGLTDLEIEALKKAWPVIGEKKKK
jgi:hypothetical protein